MPGIGEPLALPAPSPKASDDTNGALVVFEGVQSLSIAPPAKKQEAIATSTTVVGVIRPPPDIRSIVDKTAQFVARNGPEFEKRILANEKNNVKFSFLNATDPYHAYYQRRVNDFREQLAGGAAPVKPAADGQGAAPKEQLTAEEAPVAPPASSLVAPEPEQYLLQWPEGLTGQDLDIIKLTAQFVARNGKSFLTGLTSREHSNARFQFLKPTHSLFSLFTSLTDAYSKVLMPHKGLLERLEKDAGSRTLVLERCLQRLEWEKSEERARQKAEDEADRERTQMALIDWHDFVVVESIDFGEEEEDELPQPLTLDEVIRRNKSAEEAEEVEAQANGKLDKEAEMDVEMDAEEMTMVKEGIQAERGNQEGEEERDEDDMEEDMDEEEERPLRIVKNWKRPEERAAQMGDATKYAVSPITGELIPVSEMAEHMRISLIDPKYKEQKERMMAKLRETTLAQDDEIAKNMLHLAKTRPDIFGTTEEEVSNAVAKELERQNAAETDKVIWDGQTGTIGRTATAAIQQSQQHYSELPPAPPPLSAPRLNPPPQIRPGINMPRPTLNPLPVAPGLEMRPSLPMSQPAAAPVPPPPMRPPVMAPPPMLHALPVLMPFRPPMPNMLPVLNPSLAPPPPPPHLQLGQVAHLPPGVAPPAPPPEDPAAEEREAKRQKVEDAKLLPEDQFLAQHPGPASLLVSLPVVEDNEALKGQTVEVTVESLQETIGSVKNRLADVAGLPSTKQKISGAAGFLKDSFSLAYYNIRSGDTLSLSLKERGGRKK